MPCADTFQCEPILGFVQKYLAKSTSSVDPFARNSSLCRETNDINPKTKARHHMDARAFIAYLLGVGGASDLVLLDMPYSPRQISECYKELGITASMRDTQNGRFYKDVRDLVAKLVTDNGVVISCGWNSSGMGKNRGFEIEEILLVCHGAAHNDTICLAEIKCKRMYQAELTGIRSYTVKESRFTDAIGTDQCKVTTEIKSGV